MSVRNHLRGKTSLRIAIVTSFCFTVVGNAQSTSAATGGVTLEDEEHAVAKELGYDPAALQIVKSVTKSPLQKMDLEDESFEQPAVLITPEEIATEKKETVEFLKKLRVRYPELGAKFIDDTVKRLEQPISAEEMERAAKFKEMQEFAKAMRPFRGYIQQETDQYKENKTPEAEQNLIAPLPGDSVEALVKALHARYDGKPLLEKYKPKYCVRFVIPLSAEAISEARANSFQKIEAGQKSVIQNLRKQLKPLGYAVSEGPVLPSGKRFASLEKANAFIDSRKVPNEFASIHKVSGRTIETDFSNVDVSPSLSPVPSGSQVTKISDDKYKVKPPDHWDVEFKRLTGHLVKANASVE